MPQHEQHGQNYVPGRDAQDAVRRHRAAMHPAEDDEKDPQKTQSVGDRQNILFVSLCFITIRYFLMDSVRRINWTDPGSPLAALSKEVYSSLSS